MSAKINIAFHWTVNFWQNTYIVWESCDNLATTFRIFTNAPLSCIRAVYWMTEYSLDVQLSRTDHVDSWSLSDCGCLSSHSKCTDKTTAFVFHGWGKFTSRYSVFRLYEWPQTSMCKMAVTIISQSMLNHIICMCTPIHTPFQFQFSVLGAGTEIKHGMYIIRWTEPYTQSTLC